MANCEKCYHAEVCRNYEPKSYSACGYYSDKDLIAELPCKVKPGDVVYYTKIEMQPDRKYIELIKEAKITAIFILKNSHWYAATDNTFTFQIDLIGKSVFLTREEAKATMKWSENNAR
jgi:hypothetical protein